MNGIEEGRASFAFERVSKAIEKENDTNIKGYKAKDYKSYVKKIPMLIKTNGLGNTLAFIISKSGNQCNDVSEGEDKKYNAYDLIGKQISEWFFEKRNYLFEIKDSENNNFIHFLELVLKQDSQHYRMITIELLSLFNWLKRFAEGRIKDE